MPSQLVNELLNTMDSKIFSLVLQLILTGSVIMFVKDITSRIVNYYKLKSSDFSRGVYIVIDGKEGQISHIGFNEVEIILKDDYLMLVPVEKFMNSTKIIFMGKALDRKK